MPFIVPYTCRYTKWQKSCCKHHKKVSMRTQQILQQLPIQFWQVMEVFDMHCNLKKNGWKTIWRYEVSRRYSAPRAPNLIRSWQSFQIISNWRDLHNKIETTVLPDHSTMSDNSLTSAGLIAVPGSSEANETSYTFEDDLLGQSKDDKIRPTKCQRTAANKNKLSARTRGKTMNERKLPKRTRIPENVTTASQDSHAESAIKSSQKLFGQCH